MRRKRAPTMSVRAGLPRKAGHAQRAPEERKSRRSEKSLVCWRFPRPRTRTDLIPRKRTVLGTIYMKQKPVRRRVLGRRAKGLLRSSAARGETVDSWCISRSDELLGLAMQFGTLSI